MDKSGKQNKSTVTEIEKNVSNVLAKMQGNEKEFKAELEGIKIENASEVPIGDNKHCLLVHVGTTSDKDFKKVHPMIVNKFEEHFSTPVVIVPATKRINGKLFRKFQGTKVPRDRTWTAVFESYLDELVYPATILGKRIRFPKGKIRHYKVIVDPLDKEAIEYKVPSITACYKALTNRTLDVEFA